MLVSRLLLLLTISVPCMRARVRWGVGMGAGFMGDAPWVGLAVGDGFAAALTRKGTLYALADY
jgi:hypothetical protein